ncbi:unnamed protein product [Caenorhabditis bovis]|uniref:Uncharacterized protein n=1 Tax=Caenorhabditis bovis TaxID=2654633 RepID=A0A8S1EMU6_9PELO|nr:unnamed protein product [Caenorhabditis bovis]
MAWRRCQNAKRDDAADDEEPNVRFDGAKAVEIPANSYQSPVSTHLSLISNPDEFKYMDEIALLKRGKIDRETPKHPYNRMKKAIESSDSSDNSLFGEPVADMTEYKLGDDGGLKYWKLVNGGERYELTSGERFCFYQQSAGHTSLSIIRK